MSALRLGRLPDRNPVKLAVTVLPDLHDQLVAYAALYKEDYGVEEPITELIPAMLASFLESDREFAKRRRGSS